jgi:hypothetical protein
MTLSLFLSLLLAAAPVAGSQPSAMPQPVVAASSSWVLAPSLVGLDLEHRQLANPLQVELPGLLNSVVQDDDKNGNDDGLAVITVKVLPGNPYGALPCGTTSNIEISGYATGVSATKDGAAAAAMSAILAQLPFTCSHCMAPGFPQCARQMTSTGGTTVVTSVVPYIFPDGTLGFQVTLIIKGSWRFSCLECP